MLLGDLNIDLIKNSKIREEYLLAMAQFGFASLINIIIRPISNTCIDHIFIKTKSHANIVPIIVLSNITDHYSTILSLGNILDKRNNTPNPLKILKTDNQKLSNSFENHNWSELLEYTDVNKAIQYFTSTLNNLKHQASVEISISSKTKKLKTWATIAIINSIRQRDCLHLQVKKHPLNLKLKDYYVRFRNKIIKIIKKYKDPLLQSRTTKIWK